jgi:hypothetical protein
MEDSIARRFFLRKNRGTYVPRSPEVLPRRIPLERFGLLLAVGGDLVEIDLRHGIALIGKHREALAGTALAAPPLPPNPLWMMTGTLPLASIVPAAG